MKTVLLIVLCVMLAPLEVMAGYVMWEEWIPRPDVTAACRASERGGRPVGRGALCTFTNEGRTSATHCVRVAIIDGGGIRARSSLLCSGEVAPSQSVSLPVVFTEWEGDPSARCVGSCDLRIDGISSERVGLGFFFWVAVWFVVGAVLSMAIALSRRGSVALAFVVGSLTGPVLGPLLVVRREKPPTEKKQ